MENDFKLNVFIDLSTDHSFCSLITEHMINIFFNKGNIAENTKEVIAMINGDSLIEEKKHLGSVLAIVEDASELPGLVKRCGNCDVHCNIRLMNELC